ncbi:E3 ubiquitin-protein ligase KCMF1-like [Lampris incognitus]|uniref:E3 ubiquitin-protein ligase KCMF1-like n=1 Tax=Lampris incognitus TaxID=2546036 RepID=UPI0024B50F00|nr:E3 ubiquitin-protein ligase KCMF1-like [Lampris incognitus]
MSRHEGVSCDACLKEGFRGRRFKCLICYDYDLCASCYESGATTRNHETEHPMQCILTKIDYEMYYGGDPNFIEKPQSFTCPHCGKMGYTEISLEEHVTSEHAESSTEVICPICAATPGGDPNHATDEFAGHLRFEHRALRDIEESSSVRHARRIIHPGRAVGSSRTRRTTIQFVSGPTGGPSSASLIPTFSQSNRETMDPIAELLSQLAVAHTGSEGPVSSGSSQLEQLQMQLHLERQQAQAARQRLEVARRTVRRIPGNTWTTLRLPSTATTNTATVAETNTNTTTSTTTTSSPHSSTINSSTHSSKFLLASLNETKMSEAESQLLEEEHADRSLFAQELLLSTLMREDGTPSEEEVYRDFACFEAMGYADIMPLDVALENLQLRECCATGKDRPLPPL